MISVIMPAYNSEEYIAQAISSILNQTFEKFEFLIIDDGSIDNTGKIVQSFHDKRIKYIEKEHSGISETLNYGIEKSQYNLIARMDADDIAHPKRFQIQLDILLKYPQIDIISAWYALFDKNKISSIVRVPEKNDEIVKKMAIFCSISHPSVIFKKEKIKFFGGYNKIFDGAEDYELWLRVKNNLIFYNVQQVLTFYRYNYNLPNKHNRNISYYVQAKYYKNIEKEFNIIELNEKYYNKAVRELFYGDKRKARKIILKSNFTQIFSIRVLFIVFVSFLKRDVYEQILHSRFWLRIKFSISLLKKRERIKTKELNNVLEHYK